MNLFKLIYLFNYIKLYFNYLPKGLQLELVDTLEEYKEMIVISKYERKYNGK